MRYSWLASMCSNSGLLLLGRIAVLRMSMWPIVTEYCSRSVTEPYMLNAEGVWRKLLACPDHLPVVHYEHQALNLIQPSSMDSSSGRNAGPST